MMNWYLNVVALAVGLGVVGVDAFPQRTAYSNSSAVATQTSSSSGTGTTAGPSLTTSCALFFPVDISLNSWYTELATITVATVLTNYIQYNNTKVAVNSTTIEGVLVTIPDGGGFFTNLFPYTQVSKGFRAPDKFTVGDIPTDLIELLPTTYGYDYAISLFGTETDITTTWQPNVTHVLQSPTPFVVPSIVAIYADFYDGSSLVSQTVYQDFITGLGTGALIGGAWPTPVDWPCLTTFDSVPTQFLTWMLEYPGISTKFPFLSSCTNWTGWPMTGAPTVHIPVSTLTHETSSVVATVNSYYGSKSSTKTTKAAETTKPTTTAKLSSTEITSTTIIVIPTTTSKEAETTTAAASPTKEETTTAPEQTTAETKTTEQVPSPVATEAGTTPVLEQTSAADVSTGGNKGVTGSYSETQGTSKSSQETTAAVPVGNSVPSPSDKTTIAGNQGATATTVEGTTAAANQGTTIAETTATEATSVIAPALTIGTSAVTPNSASEYVFSTQTLAPGGSEITVGGTTYSLATSATALVQNGATQTLTPQTVVVSTAASAPELTLGSAVVTADSSSVFVYESQTLSVGGSAITAGGNTYSLATSGSATYVVANGATQPIAATSAPEITLGSVVVTANSASNFVYESQTISAGGSAVTAGGNTYSIATSGSATYIVVNGATQPAVAQTVAPKITLGSTVVAANSESAYVVGSQTLSVGGSAIAVGQTTYSLGTSGSSTYLVQNGVTAVLSSGNAATPAVSVVNVATPAITVGPNAITANSASAYVIGSQTLQAGSSAIVVSGTTYSLAASGSALVVNGATQEISQPSAQTQAYVVAGQTLTQGSAVVVSGTTYSLAPSGTAIVVNGVTSALPGSTAEVATFGSVLATSVPGGYIFAGQTLSAGSAITVSGTTYSLSPSGTAIVVNGVTSALAETTPNVATFGSALATSVQGGYVLGGQTLSAGSAITVSGTTYSLSPAGTAVVVNGVTSALSGSTPGVATFGSILATSVSGGYILAGQTLSPGSAITVSGTTYSLSPSGTAIAVNGITTAIAETTPTAAILTFGSTLATSVSGGYILAGQTLSPGSALTISGTTYSLPASGTAIVINGVTSLLPTPTAAPEYIIGSQTLHPGSTIVVSGTTYSLASVTGTGAAVLVVNGVTSHIPTPTVFAIDGVTYTAIPAASGAVVIGSQTLTQGGEITVGDETLTLGANGSVETEGPLGAMIISGLGGATTTATEIRTGKKTGTATETGTTAKETDTATGTTAERTATATQGSAAATSSGAAVRWEVGAVAGVVAVVAFGIGL